MLGLLIFDSLNDVIYTHTNDEFKKSVNDLAVKQNLAFTDDNCVFRSSGTLASQNEQLDKNVIVHLFSPLVTSHRIMNDQFKNEYESITCEDGTIICFHQLSKFLLLAIGKDSLSYLKRYVQICAKFITTLIGNSVLLLKLQPKKKHMLDLLLTTWRRLYQREQCYIVEGVERAVPDENMSSTTFNSLSAAAVEVCKCSSIHSCHILLLEDNKRLLAMYSSDNAVDLSGGYILFINLLVEALTYESKLTNEGTSLLDNSRLELQLQRNQIHFSSHIFSVQEVAPNISLVILAETNRSNLSASLLDLANAFEAASQADFSHLVKIEVYMEACNSQGQKLGEDISSKIRTALKRVKHWWDVAKDNGVLHWTKPGDVELPPRIEAALKSACDVAVNAWQSCCTDLPHVMPPTVTTRAVTAFLKRSAGCTFRSAVNVPLVTPKKYMEDFPGLVHFAYVDRYLNQMTSPSLHGADRSLGRNPQSLTESLTVSGFRSMVSFARDHLTKGHLSMLWKDKTFSYSYFLWFEDSTGNPIKPTALDDSALKALPLPGILVGDFYREFVVKAFPNHNPRQVRIYELYCIHLGLATSLCVLEQTRRLAATVWELSGPNAINPMDLL